MPAVAACGLAINADISSACPQVVARLAALSGKAVQPLTPAGSANVVAVLTDLEIEAKSLGVWLGPEMTWSGTRLATSTPVCAMPVRISESRASVRR